MNRTLVLITCIASSTGLVSHAQTNEQKAPIQEIFLECLTTQTMCTPKLGCIDEPKKYVIAWKGDSIRHLDDYGVMEYRTGCQVTERWLYCSEKKTPDGQIVRDWSQRRTILERATGNVEHIYRTDSTEQGTDLDRKDGLLPKWLLKLRGSCMPRAKANLF